MNRAQRRAAMRGRRVAAGAALAAASLMSTYAAALRPAVSYASSLARIAPRTAPSVPTCANADVTVWDDTSLRAALTVADDSVICIDQDIDLTVSSTLSIGSSTVTLVGRLPTTTIDGLGRGTILQFTPENPGDDTLTLANLTLEGGSALNDGGALLAQAQTLGDGALILDGVTFRGNRARTDGGAVVAKDLGVMHVYRSTFVDNSDRRGGSFDGGGCISAIGVQSLFVSHSSFVDCHSAGDGGALYLSSGNVARIESSTFSDNAASKGGGIRIRSTSEVSLTDDSFVNNDDTLGGGAVSLEDISGSVDIVDSYWFDNSSLSGYGGGANFKRVQDLNIVSSEFYGNVAGKGGGGLDVTLLGPGTIWNSTFAGNQADYGGGVYVRDDSLSIENSTFANNRVTVPDSTFGGGAVFSWGTWLALDFTTVVGNSVVGTTPGSAIQVGNATPDDTLTITNSIVAGNIGASGSEIAVTDNDIPLVIDYSAVTDANSIQSAGGPRSILNVIYAADSPLLLGPLQDNGGPTRTMVPGAGSSAIDAGNPAWSAPPTYDQRGAGFSRLIGTRVDIGAVEGTGSNPNPTPTPTPTPVFPAGAPRDVTATAEDASATVEWQPPTSSGSFPVSTYQVTSTPGGHTCLTTALSCTVSGLGNGTTYTFRVKALNGAGWGQDSQPSNAVTPSAKPEPSIVISIVGSRSGRSVSITGESTGLAAGAVATPWTRVGDQAAFTERKGVKVGEDGSFTWSRTMAKGKLVRVYVTSGDVRSNTVRIAKRG